MDHDATLTGYGLNNSALGVATGGIGSGQIATGAVTLPKLSIAGSPAVGSTLGYNGSALAWQSVNGGSKGGPVSSIRSATVIRSIRQIWRYGKRRTRHLRYRLLPQRASESAPTFYCIMRLLIALEVPISIRAKTQLPRRPLTCPALSSLMTFGRTASIMVPVSTADLSSLFVPPFHNSGVPGGFSTTPPSWIGRARADCASEWSVSA